MWPPTTTSTAGHTCCALQNPHLLQQGLLLALPSPTAFRRCLRGRHGRRLGLVPRRRRRRVHKRDGEVYWCGRVVRGRATHARPRQHRGRGRCCSGCAAWRRRRVLGHHRRQELAQLRRRLDAPAVPREGASASTPTARAGSPQASTTQCTAGAQQVKHASLSPARCARAGPPLHQQAIPRIWLALPRAGGLRSPHLLHERVVSLVAGLDVEGEGEIQVLQPPRRATIQACSQVDRRVGM